MRLVSILALALAASFAQAQTTINAVYFGQSHVLKASDTYFGLVGNRETLIKAHVVNPTTPASPAVTATLSLSGQTLVLPLVGPATLPASIPDGPGVVQHTFTNTFTGYLPAAWVKTGLQVTVNAGTANTTITNMKVGAPTKVIMTMTDVQYFSDTNSNYPTNTFAEVEAKWPVADLEVRRLGHVVFPELVIPPRTDVGTKAERIRSKAEYTAKTGLPFDGEQAAALAWNGALKRAAGRSGRWSLYYLNVYNAFAGGQAGGFAGVGAGNSVGILHHELGHALSLPHWGDSGSYPYKGAMHGISAPSIYNGTHAGPTWAFDLRTKAFIPPTTQIGNAGGKPVGTYKADPMQGGGEGWQEPAYRMNHFSDYSMNQMRSYLHGHVVVWNAALNSWAEWNSTAGDYTTKVSNNGVQFPTVRDTEVITIMASISGSDPDVTMVYPPIGPYTAGLIRLFDPAVAADRTAAQSIFSPSTGSDLCARVVQGGVTKTYMLAASWVTTQDEYSSGSLVTEAINLPAADGEVTKIELLLTPNAEDVGLPVNPQVLSTWAPLTPEPAEFESAPKAYSSSAVTMKAVKGSLAFGFTGTVEYLFTETTGNPGATSSAWQTSRSYTDTGLQAGTQYSYTVSMRAGTNTVTPSAAASANTLAVPTTKTATVNSTQEFSLVADLEGFRAVTGLGTFDAGTADKLVVVVSTEDKNNSGTGYVYDIRYNGKLMTEVIQEEAGSGNGTAAIFYLDNPGPRGTGTIEVSAELPNGGMGAAYALSNTMAGFAVTNSRTGTTANSVSFTTAGQNSVVIAVLDNAGNPNSAGTPTASSPLTAVSSGSWGSGWGSHASGYRLVATPTAITPTFSTSTGASYSINVAAAEFPAQPPLPNVWSQTAGGTQNWTTATNWEDGVVPAPTSSTTMDFSTVDLLADTNLVLGAARTARIWKFGDASGTQNWTVNSGNTLTLAGTTPTIEVKNNTTQFNNVVAGTAGLAKTGAGTLFLNGTNTFTGVTRISAGTLQAATLANGGSNCSIGAATNAASNLILNGGTLQYTGAAVSTNRLFSLQATSTIDASGTGAVNFTSTGTMGFSSSTADKTLTLTGSNTDANTIAAIIGDNIVDITGITSLTKSGVGTWVLSGANTYTGNTTISGGTLRLANTAAVSGSSLLAIGGNRLEIATNTAFSGPAITSQLGTIVSDRATAGAGLTHVLGNAVIGNGLSNFTAGTNVTSGTAAIQLGNVTNNNGSTATPGLNPTTANLIITGDVTLGTSNTGTANLTLGGTGSVNSIGGIIENGTRATGNVIKSGTSTWTLSGLSATAASNYNGSTTIDQGTLRFTTTSPSLTGGLTFGASASGTNSGTLDLSTASATFGSVNVQTNSPATITIGSGRTLTLTDSAVTNVVTVGTATLPGLSRLVVTGATEGVGTLTVNDATRNIVVSNGSGANGATAISSQMDLSGLGAFNATIANLYVGRPTLSTGLAANATGRPNTDVMTLAGNNIITASGVIAVGGSNSSFGASTATPSRLLLGTANTINAASFVLGSSRLSGTMAFNSGLTNPAVTLRGAAGGSTRTNIHLGDQGNLQGISAANGGSTTSLGTMDFTGGSVNARVENLLVGMGGIGFNNTRARGDGSFTMAGAASNVDVNSLVIGQTLATENAGFAGTSGIGTFTVANGTLQVNTAMTIANDLDTTATASGTVNVQGTFTVAGGTANIGAPGTPVNLLLGNHVNAGNPGLATATVSLTGGTLNIFGNITEGNPGAGTITSSLSLNGATLDMRGNSIGTSGALIDTLTFASGTLSNVATINGTGGLTKTTPGTLTLSGANNYAGTTTLSAGTLALGANNALPATAVSIGSATLDAATFTDTLGSLDVTSSAIINLGTGASLSFADSSGIDWTGGTLTLTGTFVSGSSLRFGTTSGGLTSTQLGKITATGVTGFALNGSGYLTAIPTVSFASWITSAFTSGQVPTNQRGPNDDPDNDGIRNLVEYAIAGQDPTVPNSTIGTFTTNSLSFNKRAGAIGITYAIQDSTDLGVADPWTEVGSYAVNNASTISHNFTPGTTQKNFLRLQVLSN